jgi:RNA polymerase sigma factor (sigma-70 family)
MGQPPDRDPPLSSTLRQVKAVQSKEDAELNWANLHTKIQRLVEEASWGQNLPRDKSLDDLTQEVLLQIYKDIGEFKVEPEASFSGWVRTVAARKLTDYWRRERAKKRGKGRVRNLGEFDEDGGREHFADARTPRQSMLVRYKELTDSIDKALVKLTGKHKRVIELRLFQGKSFAEILPELGYSKEVTVRSLYMRAMEQLQALLPGFDDELRSGQERRRS